MRSLILLSLCLAQTALSAPAPKRSPAPSPAAATHAGAAAHASTAAHATAPAAKSAAKGQSKPVFRPAEPSTRFPKGTRVESGPRKGDLKEIVIAPSTPASREPTLFELVPGGAPGRLTLRFKANDPSWTLDPSGPLTVQLNADAPLEVEPSIILREDWPKNSSQMNLSLRGGKAGQIVGKAAYAICQKTTRKCQTTLSLFQLTLPRSR